MNNISNVLKNLSIIFIASNLITLILFAEDKTEVFEIIKKIESNDSFKNMPSLSKAAYCGDITLVKKIIQNGADINEKDNQGRTALMLALDCSILELLQNTLNENEKKYLEIIRNRKNEIAKLFLDYNADVNIMDIQNRNALLYSLNCSSNEIKKIIYEKTSKNEIEEKFINFAKQGEKAEIDYLLKLGVNVNCKNSFGATPLISALISGHVEIAKTLIENGADLNAVCLDLTPLIIGLSHNNLEIISYLLKKGANPNIHPNNKIPLRFAIMNGDISTIQMLINYGANINMVDDMNSSTLDFAVSLKKVDVLELLFKNNINISSDNITNAVGLAIVGNDINTIKFLLDKTGNLLNKSKNCCKLLLISATRGYCDILKLLLAKDIRVDSQCGDLQETALMKASENGQEETVNLLLRYKANINAQNIDGLTPVMYAVMKGHLKVIKLLIDNGANITLTDNQKETVFNKAKKTDKKEIEIYLNSIKK